jgi:phage portal protein, HK97 family
MNIFTRVASAFKSRESKVDPRWMSLGYYDDVPMAVRMSKNFKSFVKEGYKDSDTLYKCVSYIIRNGSAIPPVLFKDSTMKSGKIDEHPLLDLLNKPNEDQSGVAYREAALGYKILAGNCFQYANRVTRDGPPAELYTLRPDKIEMQIVKNKGIVGYKYDTLRDVITPDNIGHTKYWNPDDDDQAGMGLSPLEAAALNIDMQSHSKKWNLALLQNSARPPGIWKYGALLGPNERKKLEDKLNEKFAGAKGAGKAPLFDGGVDWKPTGLDPAQMDFLDSLKYNGGAIANILNIAPQLIGDTSSSTYDNMEQAKAASYTEAIFPELDDLYALWNTWLVPMYSDLKNSKAFLYYDKESVEVIANIIQAQKTAQAERANEMWMNGLGTLNECRELCGLPPVPDGDVLKIGTILIRLDEIDKYAEQSLTMPAVAPAALPEPLNVPDPTKPGQPNQPDPTKPSQNNDQQQGNANNKPGVKPPDNRDDNATSDDAVKPKKSDERRYVTKDDDEGHTGVMIAFFPDAKTAKKLALPDGEPVNQIHLTLAFLGDKNDIDLDVDALKKLLSDFASEASPLSGITSGVLRFSPSDSSNGLSPICALVNISGLQKWRANLVETLEAAHVNIANNFDYQPHITLAYIDSEDHTPIDDVPSVNLNFDQLWLCIGDDRYSFPIEGTPKKRQHRTSLTKALDLATNEEKQSYFKSIEKATAKWETEAEQRLQSYFKKEQKAVVNAVYEAALPSSAEDRAESAINSKASDLKEIIIELYKDVAGDVGNDILKQLKAGATDYDVKSFTDIINSNAEHYLSKMAATKIKGITETTRDQVKRELSQGVKAGETVPQLAKRIDGLYLEQIVPSRSANIAVTESHSAASWSALQAGRSSGLTLNKVWLSQNDGNVRPAHRDADGQQVGIDETFVVDGENLDYPGNPSGSPENCCKCRCFMWFKKSEAKQSNDEEDNSNDDKSVFSKYKSRSTSKHEYRKFMELALK